VFLKPRIHNRSLLFESKVTPRLTGWPERIRTSFKHSLAENARNKGFRLDLPGVRHLMDKNLALGGITGTRIMDGIIKGIVHVQNDRAIEFGPRVLSAAVMRQICDVNLLAGRHGVAKNRGRKIVLIVG